MGCTFPVSATWTACATHWLVPLDSAYWNKCWGQVFRTTVTAKPITVTIWRRSTVSCCALFLTRRVTNNCTSCKTEHHIMHIPFVRALTTICLVGGLGVEVQTASARSRTYCWLLFVALAKEEITITTKNTWRNEEINSIQFVSSFFS